MVEVINNLHICDIYLILYPDEGSANTMNPLGLYISFSGKESGLLTQIDLSGDFIDIDVVKNDDLINEISFGELYQIDPESPLHFLKGKTVNSISIAKPQKNTVSGQGFEVSTAQKYALQLIGNDWILTFLNEGNEGLYSFDLDKRDLVSQIFLLEWETMAPIS